MGLCWHPHRHHGCHLDVPRAGLNISSLTVLAFILVLGIVVDDAIVVGERIFAWEQKGIAKRAAIEGAHEVLTPVILAYSPPWPHSCQSCSSREDGRFFLADRLGRRDLPRV